MSSKNDETSGIAAGAGILITLLAFAALFIFAVLAFLAFGLTVLCFFAWNKPITLGKWTIEPDEARSFVLRGIAGMWLVPIFVAFCSILFGINIVWSYLPHMMAFGYVGGSIGIDILTSNSKPSQEIEILPPTPQLPAPPQPTPFQQRPAQPFEFATWEDEEGKR